MQNSKELPKTKRDELLPKESGLNKPSIPRTFSESISFGPMKKLLSFFIFKLAKDVLTRCKRRKPENPIMEILEVYILTVVGLEALINEICLDKIDQRKKAKKSIACLKKLVYENKGHYIDLKSKYDELPQILWGKSFNKGGKAWCDFDALINLRNEIVHHTPQWEDPGYIPDYLRSIYRRISPSAEISPDTGSFLGDILAGNPSFISRICNMEMGKWAFDTGKGMIQQLLTLWPRRDTMRNDYIFMFERSGLDFHAYPTKKRLRHLR